MLVAVLAVLCPGSAAIAAPVPLPVTAVLVDGGRTSLVVDLSAGSRDGKRSVSVTRDGTPQQAKLVPVVSDGLAVTLVVDTSAAGAATLPAWLSAGARFILEAPSTTQAVVIGDSAPAAAITEPQRGPTGVVRALTTVRAHGDRDTAAALTLAARQFPAAGAGRRVVVLYTTGADAGGESAGALGARFRASGTILVVVSTAGDAYWAGAAAATGGFFAPAGNPVVIPALDQVETTLRGRYLVQFPTPPTLPSRVSVQVGTGDLTLAGDALVAVTQAPAAPSARGTSKLWTNVVPGLAAAVAALILAILLLLRRRRSRSSPPPQPQPQPQSHPQSQPQSQQPPQSTVQPQPSAPPLPRRSPVSPPRPATASAERIAEPPAPDVARGRAVVPGAELPGSVARGRASVPLNGTKISRTQPPE